jgi:hypothetical protein
MEMTIFLMGKQRSGSGAVSRHNCVRGEGDREGDEGRLLPSSTQTDVVQGGASSAAGRERRHRHWWRRGGVREREGAAWGGAVWEREDAVEYGRGRE